VRASNHTKKWSGFLLGLIQTGLAISRIMPSDFTDGDPHDDVPKCRAKRSGRERRFQQLQSIDRRTVISLIVNGQHRDVDVDPETPLLWVIRDEFGLTGTKFGCGVAQCGCCTVHVNGEVTRSCVVPVATVAGKRIDTIESLSTDNSHPVQRAWIAEQVPQCGYCQSGQIMAAAGLLAKTPKPTDEQINTAMTNICRCGTYDRIRAAIHRVAGEA
jgi:aerobic-type carbon monoxide dehydrogenase small subunit (CoxS/CutS family)